MSFSDAPQTAAEVAAAHREDDEALLARARSLGHSVPRYVGLAECTTLVRERLARQFPTQHFSVKRDRPGGSSVAVKWEGGPSEDDVAEVTRPLHGWVYDGSIDLAEPRPAIVLLPDGSTDFVQYAAHIVWLSRAAG